ncbi:uncharacterized protein [Drosophila pseudoobscura]|uniref:Uncharacterized protein n=1 Tax=Drosophila pseudoobscura pseudoobscura TaxID=46245 RepID=A0A6I8V6A9_DROPS|nr:uncharacterized protein LOC6899099 [Drosophila pseudoobscura]
MMHQIVLPFVRTLSEQQVLKAVKFIERESQERYLYDGQINMLHNLRKFEIEPFVLILDKFHVKWDWHGKWKVLAIAGFNLDGSNFNYLHMKLAMVEDKIMGSEEIDDSLSMVLEAIKRHGYSNRLMGIISAGCPANLLTRVSAAREYPVLWDIVHLRKILAKYRVVDRVLSPVYNFHFTAAKWRDTEFPPVRVDFQNRIAEDLTQLKHLIARVCSYPFLPFTTLNRLNSTDLELSGLAITAMVTDIISDMSMEGRRMFKLSPYKFMATLVGVSVLDTPNPDGVHPG